MKRKFIINVYDIFTFIIVLYELICVIFDVVLPVFWGSFIMWGITFLYSLFGNHRIKPALLCFQITNFVFLYGGTFISYLIEGKPLFNFPDEILKYTYFLLFISQLFIFISYRLYFINRIHIGKGMENYFEISKIRSVSLTFFYISFLPNLLVTINNIKYASENSYAELYLRTSNDLPFFINKISQLFTISLYLYLATLPKKKNALFPISIFLFVRMLTVLSGRRTDFMLAVITLFFYFLIRDKIGNGERWFGKFEKNMLIVLLPILILALVNINNIRSGRDVMTDLGDGLLTFFKDQGVSITVIEYGKYYQNQIPKQPYLFGPIIDFLKYNEITSLFYKFPTYGAQTIQQAHFGASFADTISYLAIPYDYSRGYGLGSSYIAEAYHTLGYLGVVIINTIFGIVLKIIDYSYGRTLIRSYFLLFILNRILYAPRSTGLSFISSTFTVTNILFVVSVLLISKKISYNFSKGNLNQYEK